MIKTVVLFLALTTPALAQSISETELNEANRICAGNRLVSPEKKYRPGYENCAAVEAAWAAANTAKAQLPSVAAETEAKAKVTDVLKRLPK